MKRDCVYVDSLLRAWGEWQRSSDGVYVGYRRATNVERAIRGRRGHEPEWENEEALHRLDGIIAKLDPKLRRPVELRYLHGLSYRESGQVLGLNHTTIQYWVEKAWCAIDKVLLN